MNRVGVVAIAVLAVLSGFQWRALRLMKAEVETLRADAAAVTRRSTLEQFNEEHRDEMQRAIAWLNDFYAAREGLQRSQGLCHDGRLDAQGLVVWLYDGYLRLRVDGQPEGLARQKVADAIKGSDEWRALHASRQR
jgi:hypothetical protein